MCVDAGEIDIYLKNLHFSGLCTKIGHKTQFNFMITTLKNRIVLKIILYYLDLSLIQRTKYFFRKIHVSSTSRIGPIPKK